MKLPFKSDTASKLARAHEDLAATEAAIASAQQERLSKLLDAEPGEIERLDRSIEDQHRALAVYADRIAGLQLRLQQEQADENERRRQAAIEKVGTLLPKWRSAAEKFEKWLRSGDAALSALTQARAQIVQDWPGELADEKPYSFFFDLTRAIKRLHAAVTPNGVNPEAADGFTAREQELMDELLEHLKQVPKPDAEIAA